MKTLTKKMYINQVLLVKILLLLISLLVVAYLYFINSISFTTASYEKTRLKISYAQSEIAELESSLIQFRRNLDMESGLEIGLVSANVSETIFVNRTTPTRLTINE